LTKDDALVAALNRDYRRAKVVPKDRAMLAYSAKLTKSPWLMRRSDVEKLRRAGFRDDEIHDIAAVASHFAFVNRLADGLGVELEGWRRQPSSH